MIHCTSDYGVHQHAKTVRYRIVEGVVTFSAVRSQDEIFSPAVVCFL